MKSSRESGDIRHLTDICMHHHQTETVLQTYSQFSTVSNIPAKPTEEETNTEVKLEELLEKVWIKR